MKSKQMYATPVVKTFKVSLEGNCCQVGSPFSVPPTINPYSGEPLGDDFM